MHYSKIFFQDTVNGEGNRVTLFVSGCNHGCHGCWAPETWDFKYGVEYTSDLEQKIIDTLNLDFYSGLSILGGDPLSRRNRPTIYNLVQRVKSECKNNNIWIWTGYTYEECIIHNDISEILSYCDILVDGKFDKNLYSSDILYRGSSNQRIIDVHQSLNLQKVINYLP